MRRNDATPGAREELHFLFEESVFGKIKTAEEKGSGGEDWRGRRGVIDWWRPLKGVLSEPVRNAPCLCLLEERQRWRGGESG